MKRDSRSRRTDLRWMTGTALMMAITIVLGNTPLGLITLPFLTATTLHIPVIIATLTLGLGSGLLTGLVFGVQSFFNSFTSASFFGPFFINPLISVLPRLLFPVFVYAIAQGVKRLTAAFDRRHICAYLLSSALGTVLHTAMVMGMMYLLNGDAISRMISNGAGVPQVIAERGAGLGILALAVANGVPEMIVACVIAPVVVMALERALRIKNGR